MLNASHLRYCRRLLLSSLFSTRCFSQTFFQPYYLYTLLNQTPLSYFHAIVDEGEWHLLVTSLNFADKLTPPIYLAAFLIPHRHGSLFVISPPSPSNQCTDLPFGRPLPVPCGIRDPSLLWFSVCHHRSTRRSSCWLSP